MLIYTCKVRACKINAHELHPHRMHANEIYAHKTLHKIHAREVHTHEVLSKWLEPARLPPWDLQLPIQAMYLETSENHFLNEQVILRQV
jgi:hypothetical protein